MNTVVEGLWVRKVEGWWGGEKTEAEKGEEIGTRVVVGKEERLMAFSTGNTVGKEKRPWFSILTFPFNQRIGGPI
jgi:hypothetical protein